MIRVLALAAALAISVPAAAETIGFTQTARIEGERFPIPMTVELVPLDDTRLSLRFVGDLGAIQRNLPAILSRHIEDSCERRISVAVTDARARGTTIRLDGQLQAEISVCRNDGTRDIREQMLKQTARLRTDLAGKLVDGCLVMRVVETSVRPDGFTGALMDATGYTARLNRDLEQQLDRALTEDDNCIEVPEEFRAFDAVVTGGRFEEIGEGTLAAVIEAEMIVNATNFVRLMKLLERKRRLGD